MVGQIGPRQASLVASAMRPTFTSQTWSLLRTGSRVNCHAFFLTAGSAHLMLQDGSAIDLREETLVWIPSTLGREFNLHAGGSGIAVSVPPEFVWATIGESSLAVDLKFMMNEVALATPDTLPVAEVRMSFEAMVRETGDAGAGSSAIVRLSLGLVLLHIWRAVRAGSHSAAPRSDLVPRFRQLVELHFREGLAIADYASQLGVTRGKLGDACMRAESASPLTIVHARVLEEAQRKLTQTDMSVEQVAYSLGFRDPPYFNRFFTRKTGINPGAYRKITIATSSPERPSFAAWP